MVNMKEANVLYILAGHKIKKCVICLLSSVPLVQSQFTDPKFFNQLWESDCNTVLNYLSIWEALSKIIIFIVKQKYKLLIGFNYLEVLNTLKKSAANNQQFVFMTIIYQILK